VGLKTLKRRADFLRVRGGLRWATPSLVVEAKPRDRQNGNADCAGARFGYTVSKKVGKAVIRNRTRRRLKAATTELLGATRPELDYVIIARPEAVNRSFAELKADLAQAFARIDRAAEGGKARRAKS